MGQPLPPKKEVVLALLERATVFVHVDPRRQGCVVPINFKSQPQLVLQIGLNMAVPIPDLRVDDTGITCTLSFGGRGFWCSLPWSCVYAMVGEDGRGMVWPDDLPPEVRATTGAPDAGATKPSPAAAPAPALAPAKAARKAPTKEPVKASRKAKAPKADEAPEEKKPKKRASKKKGETPPPPEAADIRQRLVAVKPATAETQEPVERQAPPETPPPLGQRKPKRELPPYLRVVK